MPNTSLSVMVDEGHKDRFSEIKESCRKAGLNIEQELDAIGLITGSIDSSKVNDIKKIDGVSFVEPSKNFQIAPPGSDIQ